LREITANETALLSPFDTIPYSIQKEVCKASVSSVNLHNNLHFNHLQAKQVEADNYYLFLPVSLKTN
jgi:hypothetical protein